MGRTIDRILDGYNLLDYISRCGYTVLPIGSCYTLQEHDSFRIFPESNTYFHSSVSPKRCNIINFASWHHGISSQEAIKRLAVGLNNTAFPQQKGRFQENLANAAAARKEQPLVLPEPSDKQYKRVFAYLNRSRGIDRTIIQDFVSRKLLYEDTKGNATFVGLNEQKEPCFCFQRGTNPEHPYKRIVAGSAFSHGLYMDHGAARLFVTEAVIDNLSIMTLLNQAGMDYKSYDYLATCGPSRRGLLTQIANRPQIHTVYLAFDNDRAGNEYRNKARRELLEQGYGGRIIDKPPTLKDFNLDLQTQRTAHPQHTPATHQQTLTIGGTHA